MTFFVRIVVETGAIDGWGEVPASQLPGQKRAGMLLLECRHDTVTRANVDNQTTISVPIDWLRDALRDRIDQESGAFRRQFITDTPGQSQTYEKKEEEARRWQSGDNASSYPFMAAEAAVRGLTIAQVRGEIMAQVNALTPVAALIEAHRRAAKQAVLTASGIPAMIAAAVVDWDGLLS